MNKKMKIAVDTTENVSDEDFLKIHEELHELSLAVFFGFFGGG